MNTVTLIGRLGKNPEIKNTETIKIASFPLATSKKWKDKSGEKVEKTTWHSITVFGKLADIVESYMKQGDQVAIIGEINTEMYEKNGEKRYSTKIIANQLEMLGSNDSKPQEPKQGNNPNQMADTFDDEEVDLPF